MIHLFPPNIEVGGDDYLNADYELGDADASLDDCDLSRLVPCDRTNIDDYCFDYSIDVESLDLVVEVVVASLSDQTSIVQSIHHLFDLVDSDWSDFELYP